MLSCQRVLTVQGIGGAEGKLRRGHAKLTGCEIKNFLARCAVSRSVVEGETSVSDIVRKLVDEYLSKQSTMTDLIRPERVSGLRPFAPPSSLLLAQIFLLSKRKDSR